MTILVCVILAIGRTSVAEEIHILWLAVTRGHSPDVERGSARQITSSPGVVDQPRLAIDANRQYSRHHARHPLLDNLLATAKELHAARAPELFDPIAWLGAIATITSSHSLIECNAKTELTGWHCDYD